MNKRRYECKGHVVHHHDLPSEFDCDYLHVGDITCDQCILCGGSMSPQTGKLFRGNRALYPETLDERDSDE